MRPALRAVPQTSSPFALRALATARPIPELAPVRKIRFIRSVSSTPKVEPPSEAEDGEKNNRRRNLSCRAMEEQATNNCGQRGDEGRDDWRSDVAPRSLPSKYQSQSAVAQNPEENVGQENAEGGAKYA